MADRGRLQLCTHPDDLTGPYSFYELKTDNIAFYMSVYIMKIKDDQYKG
jgi:hypothetical protein